MEHRNRSPDFADSGEALEEEGVMTGLVDPIPVASPEECHRLYREVNGRDVAREEEAGDSWEEAATV